MKYLLVAAVLLIAFGIWRSKHRKPAAPAHKKPNAHRAEDMVTCAHCGVHLPNSDALPTPDQRSHYCSREHQRLGPR